MPDVQLDVQIESSSGRRGAPSTRARVAHRAGHGPAHAPHSLGQDAQLSPAAKSQNPFPHPTVQDQPHTAVAAHTQVSSHPIAQQWESTSQMAVTHGSQVQASGVPTAHSECAHAHGPQSAGQVQLLSPPPQPPSPQVGTAQAPQSLVHDAQLSPRLALQWPSPHAVGHGPQSNVQLPQASPAPQSPSPQVGRQAPQSGTHEPHDSPCHPSQNPSPQAAAQGAQSRGQVVQLSPAPQLPSPHTITQAPHSPQVAHVSPARHTASPHVAHDTPQYVWASATQSTSQPPTQQKGSTAHTCATQVEQVARSAAPCVHSAWAHGAQVPQS